MKLVIMSNYPATEIIAPDKECRTHLPDYNFLVSTLVAVNTGFQTGENGQVESKTQLTCQV